MLQQSESVLTTTRRVAALAAPVALGELGWMLMSVVDTVMVGKLGPAAIGAIGIGNSVFYFVAICCMGLLFGLDTLVSQAFGAGARRDCQHSLMQGIYIAIAISIPATALMYLTPACFRAIGIVPDVAAPAGQFAIALGFSALPLLIYGAFRRYLQALHRMRPVMFALVSANIVNWFFNYVLIPRYGVVGSALSTCIARVYMAAVLVFVTWRMGDTHKLFRAPDWKRISTLLRIGFPASVQIAFEMGAFGAVGLLAGRINADSIAAHQIALNCAAFSFMVPLGIASAAAVSVGKAIGSGELSLARRCGFVAVALGCAFMACAALVFIFFPRPILIIYTHSEGVIATGSKLLLLAAGFQLFDGAQTVLTGALRGAGKTRVPMIVNFCGYWIFGLPVGYVLAFHYGMSVFGLWWGLTIGLVIVSLILIAEWWKESKHLSRYLHPQPQPVP